MVGKRFLLMGLLVLVSSFATEASAQIYNPDVDGNGVVNTADIDLWNFLYPIYLANPVPALGDLLDVWFLDPAIGTGDRDTLVVLGLGISYGDANADGIVNAADLNICAINQDSSGGWAQGDFNGDGWVDEADLECLYDNWQNTGGLGNPPPPPFGGSSGGGAF